MKSHLLFCLFLFINNSLIAQFSTEHLAAYSYSDVEEMAYGDLDGDGDEDLAFVSRNSDMVAWIENLDGAGKMSILRVLDETFTYANALEIADLNGDGNLDIIAIALGQNGLSQIVWYPSEGSGAFGAKKVIHQQNNSISGNKWRLEIMDVDSDNDLDLMVGYGSGPATMMWIDNFDGLGNFLPPTTIFSIDWQAINDFTIGDIDNDDDLDFVVIRRNNSYDSLFWYENNLGDFSEFHFIHFANAQQTAEVKVLDVDGDNDLDIVTLADFVEEFQYFENQGDGNMASGISIFTGASVNPKTFCLADIDADNDLDIAFHGNGESIFILENLDDDLFSTPQIFSPVESSAHDLIYGVDLNGDGADEIVSSGGSKILTYKNDGLGNNSDVAIVAGGLGNYSEFAIADFDNNGFTDISGILSPQDVVWFNNEGNQFVNPQFVTNELNDIIKTQPIDLNGDGAMDLVILSDDFYDNRLVGLLNDGLGNFPTLIDFAAETGVDYFSNFFFEDLDNDGDKDLFITKSSGTYWMENTDGLSDFGTEQFLTEVRADEYIFDDLDGDGDKDFYFSRSFGENIYFLENIDDNGNYLPAVSIINEEAGISSFSKGDFDADGDLDLVVVFRGEGDILIFYNDNHDFSETQEIYNGFSFNSLKDVIAFDVDYDGLSDLLYQLDDELIWKKNIGNGTFLTSNYPAQSSAVSEMALYDMDEDGDEDLLVSNFRKLVWLENVALNPTITAINFYDNNENGQQDADDFLLFNTSILLNPNGLYTFPNNDGIYQFAVNNGSYNLIANQPNNWASTTDSLSYFVEVTDGSVQKAFGWKPATDLTIIEANLASGTPRCDLEVPFWLSYTNHGTTVNDALIQLEIDELVSFISATPTPDSIQGNVYYWNVAEVLPTHTGNISLTMLMPDAYSTGEITTFPYQTTVFDNDANPVFQQQDTLFNEIRCAYDPNDKQVVPDRGEPFHPIGLNEQLEYTVRFQNTGNDTAYNVFIKDQLDENLDWTTITPLQSSHPMDMTLDENGLVTFRFLNIYLPDSLSNPVGSQGFIKYQIDLKSGLEEGLVIENTAQIIFDTNPAIITNTTQNTLSSEFTNTNPIDSDNFVVEYAPNPFSEVITFKITGKVPLPELILEIFDVQGKKIATEFIGNSNVWSYYPKGLNTGVYFFSIKDKNTGKTIANQKIIHVQNN